jgi:polyhydroxybutyrate depolymerase
VSFHGTDDPLVPYDGGQLFGSSDRLRGRSSQPSNVTIKPTEDQLAGWAQRNGCTVGPTRTERQGSVSEMSYSQCRDGADTVLYRIEGGGHTWPGATAVAERALGPTTQDIDATVVILEFFDAHP